MTAMKMMIKMKKRACVSCQYLPLLMVVIQCPDTLDLDIQIDREMTCSKYGTTDDNDYDEEEEDEKADADADAPYLLCATVIVVRMTRSPSSP